MNKCTLENITILLVTNVSILPDDELLSLLKQCKNVNIDLSIDSYGTLNEFLRKIGNTVFQGLPEPLAAPRGPKIMKNAFFHTFDDVKLFQKNWKKSLSGPKIMIFAFFHTFEDAKQLFKKISEKKSEFHDELKSITSQAREFGLINEENETLESAESLKSIIDTGINQAYSGKGSRLDEIISEKILKVCQLILYE